MGRKKLPLIEKIEITDIGARGKAIAKVDNFVTFVSNGLPGDVVDLQITRRKKSFQEGRVVRFHEYSTRRTEPFCQHFGQCGLVTVDDDIDLLLFEHTQVGRATQWFRRAE